MRRCVGVLSWRTNLIKQRYVNSESAVLPISSSDYVLQILKCQFQMKKANIYFFLLIDTFEKKTTPEVKPKLFSKLLIHQ